MARQPRPSQHLVFQSRIVECSPCIAAMLAERTRIQALHQARRRMIVAVAAGVCLVALLSGLWLWHRAPSFTRDQVASAETSPRYQLICGRTPRRGRTQGKAPGLQLACRYNE